MNTEARAYKLLLTSCFVLFILNQFLSNIRHFNSLLLLSLSLALASILPIGILPISILLECESLEFPNVGSFKTRDFLTSQDFQDFKILLSIWSISQNFSTNEHIQLRKVANFGIIASTVNQ